MQPPGSILGSAGTNTKPPENVIDTIGILAAAVFLQIAGASPNRQCGVTHADCARASRARSESETAISGSVRRIVPPPYIRTLIEPDAPRTSADGRDG